MTKIKASIIQTLKEFEQQDYKRGGVSIAPEMYNAIADELPTHGRVDGNMLLW